MSFESLVADAAQALAMAAVRGAVDVDDRSEQAARLAKSAAELVGLDRSALMHEALAANGIAARVLGDSNQPETQPE